jgi:ferric-dicitrate binding protein FerR (iron transport regulator)
MDALKLFYESKFGPVQRQAPERSTTAAPRTSEATNTADRLLRRIEAHAGQPLRSDEAIDAYFENLPRAEGTARPAGRSLLRETALVLFLLIAVLQYYYMDVALQISSLNRVTVFVPTDEPPVRNDRS